MLNRRHLDAYGAALRTVPTYLGGTEAPSVGVVVRADGTSVVAAQTRAGPALYRLR